MKYHIPIIAAITKTCKMSMRVLRPARYKRPIPMPVETKLAKFTIAVPLVLKSSSNKSPEKKIIALIPVSY